MVEEGSTTYQSSTQYGIQKRVYQDDFGFKVSNTWWKLYSYSIKIACQWPEKDFTVGSCLWIKHSTKPCCQLLHGNGFWAREERWNYGKMIIIHKLKSAFRGL